MAKIISLNRCSEFSSDIVGEKAKNLSIISKDYPIPEGFVLPYDFIQEAIDNSGIDNDKKKVALNKETLDELESIYSALNVSENDFLGEKTISQLVIRPSCLPSQLNKEIPTIINIQDFKSLVEYLEKELFAFYEKKSKGGIIVQKLVKPKISGLVSASEKTIEIKTNYGYSKSIREGYFDSITFDRVSREVNTSIGNKKFAYIFNKETKDIEQAEVVEHKAYELSAPKEIINRAIQIALYLESLGFTEFEFAYTEDIIIISAKKGEIADRIISEQTSANEQNKENSTNNENDEFIDLLSMDLFSEDSESETKTETDNINFNIEVIDFQEDDSKQETNFSNSYIFDETTNVKKAITQAEAAAENFFRIINNTSNQQYNTVKISEILDKLIQKFVIINPALEGPLKLLKEEFLRELENQK